MAKDRSDKYVSDGSDFTIISSKRACLTCKHKHDTKNTCDVFPKRIDKEILGGGECDKHKSNEE